MSLEDKGVNEMVTPRWNAASLYSVEKMWLGALGYSNGRDAVRKHVEGEDKTTVAFCDTGSNYKTQAIFINESGLYAPLYMTNRLRF